MQIKVTSKPDDTTDLIFMQKLADYCEQKGINLSFMTTPSKVTTVFEAHEDRLQELKEYLESKQDNV